MILNILGSDWTVEYRNADADPLLKEDDGYTDHSVRLIVIANKREDCSIQDYKYMQRENLRHEIVHAFLFESGLGFNLEHNEFGHEETMIDWIAIQFPKILKVFKEAGCL